MGSTVEGRGSILGGRNAVLFLGRARWYLTSYALCRTSRDSHSGATLLVLLGGGAFCIVLGAALLVLLGGGLLARAAGG